MKQLLFILILFSFTSIVHSQNCSNIHSFNNYYRNVPIKSGGHLWEETFFLEETQTDHFSIFASNLWAAGVDPAGNLKLNAKNYRDHLPGPLHDSDASEFLNPCNYFDRLWVISGAEINQQRENYQEGIVTEENTPSDILEWPAIGNEYFDIGAENGSKLGQELAPFFDNNLDGIYNALDGDLPIYKSGVVFESLNDVWAPYIFSFNVHNDNNSAMDFSTDRLPLEILQSSYLLNCPDNQDLNYTVFYNFNVKYKGTQSLSDFKLGFWEDVDFGCFDNDYLGCSPNTNTVFYYNSEPGVEFCNNVEPIGVDFGMTKNTILLSHELKSFIYYNNAAVGISNPATIDPEIGQSVNNLLSGTWIDGTPMTIGGTGYNPGSTNETKFAFHDLPNDANGWTMVNESLGEGDRRAVLGVSVSENLNSGENIVVDIASHVLFDPSSSHLGVFENFEERVEVVKNAYNTILSDPQSFNNCAVATTCVDECVWPGNVLPDNQVDGLDILQYGVILGKNWTEGIRRNQLGGLWAPHTSEDWNEQLNGINIKHADCNGDGQLSESDIQIISNNFGHTIPNSNLPTNVIAPIDDEGFHIEIDKEDVDMSGNIIGRSFQIAIRPKEMDESFDFAYHGVSFDLVFDSTLLAPFTALLNQMNHEFFDDTFFADTFYEGDQAATPFENFGNNRISVVLSSSNSVNQMPNSYLMNAYGMTVRENATTNNENGIETTAFAMENIVFMDADGNVLNEEVGYYSDELTIINLPYVPGPSSTIDFIENDLLKIIPNPATTEVELQTARPITGTAQVINLDGKIMETISFNNYSQNQISLNNYLPGVYFIKLFNEKNRLVTFEKLIIAK